MHHKLKTSPGIYLVGFMGCGKSTVGRELANRLGWDFVDLDTEIEEHAGGKITEIFDKFGELAFRAMERGELLEQTWRVKAGAARVVALGGGAFAQTDNCETLAGAGVSIWLDCPLDELWRRAGASNERPLARDRSSFEALYEERRKHYERADFRVSSAEKTPEAVVDEILALPLV